MSAAKKWVAPLVAAFLGAGAYWHFRDQSEVSIPQAVPWFRDVTAEVGLDFVHAAGGRDYFMPRAIGSGAALFDFDNDGKLDIYLLQNGGPKATASNKLFRQVNGVFKDVSKTSGLDITGYNMGVAVGDVNNDGWLDVLVTQYDAVKLFLNQGNGTFLDVTARAGLRSPSWGTSAAFFDYDRDGWLDLVIVCYVDHDPSLRCKDKHGEEEFCAPKTFRSRVSRLFHNISGKFPGQVVFEDATVSSGLASKPGPGLGVLCADFDGDGWPDILIANDGAANHLWMNQRNGTFKEEAVSRGIAYNGQGIAQAGMGIAYGDLGGTGRLDVFITHLGSETHTLWSAGAPGVFYDRTMASGVLKAHWRGTGFGTLFADFDLDGSLDLAVVNGAISRGAEAADKALGFWSRYAERNQLFANDGRGYLRDVALDNPAFCGKLNMGRGLACGDIDGDGAPDLLVTSIDGPARLFRNIASPRGHWLAVRAFDPVLKRDALGSVVRIHAGGRSWVRWLHPAESYLSSSEPRAYFGLGAIERVDYIEISWPDGSCERFPGCVADRTVELRKGH